MESKFDREMNTQMHRAELTAQKNMSKLQDSLSDLADKVEVPSRKIRAVRSGVDRAKSLPWREIALGLGGVFLIYRVRRYFGVMPKNK